MYKSIDITFVLDDLWFGDESWTNFDETTYITGPAGNGKFDLAGTTLTTPFLDLPQMEIGQ